MLHSLRTRLQQMAEREAAGESFWTSTFSERVRTRIMQVLRRIMGTVPYGDIEQIFGDARRRILEQEGQYFLTEHNLKGADDFFAYFQTCSDDMFPTVIEALIPALNRLTGGEEPPWFNTWAGDFIRESNVVITQERVGWEIIDGRMIEIHSKELHEAAVEPALRLLHDPSFAAVDKAYRDALDEIAQGKAWDAVTDAGTALQEMLTALGCEGNSLGALIRSAKTKGLIAAHDDPFYQAVDRALHWVAADRSETGDAHHATDADRADAWLIVHVVGAFIVRLAEGPRHA